MDSRYYFNNFLFALGLGFSDVENMVPCNPSTVMRIASISKAITMAAVAELIDQGKLDLDKSVGDYLSVSRRLSASFYVLNFSQFLRIYTCLIIKKLLNFIDRIGPQSILR